MTESRYTSINQLEFDAVVVYNYGDHRVLCRYTGKRPGDSGTQCMITILRWKERPQFEGAGFFLPMGESVMVPTEMEVIALAAE